MSEVPVVCVVCVCVFVCGWVRGGFAGVVSVYAAQLAGGSTPRAKLVETLKAPASSAVQLESKQIRARIQRLYQVQSVLSVPFPHPIARV